LNTDIDRDHAPRRTTRPRFGIERADSLHYPPLLPSRHLHDGRTPGQRVRIDEYDTCVQPRDREPSIDDGDLWIPMNNRNWWLYWTINPTEFPDCVVHDERQRGSLTPRR
jgi:hypothetical protein